MDLKIKFGPGHRDPNKENIINWERLKIRSIEEINYDQKVQNWSNKQEPKIGKENVPCSEYSYSRRHQLKRSAFVK